MMAHASHRYECLAMPVTLPAKALPKLCLKKLLDDSRKLARRSSCGDTLPFATPDPIEPALPPPFKD